MLKGLGRMIWGEGDKTEIVQIPSGQLYLVRPKNSVKGISECMYAPLSLPQTPLHDWNILADLVYRFKDAAASIRRTTTEFNYQLVVQRAYEEGEEQLLESDDDNLENGILPCLINTMLFY